MVEETKHPVRILHVVEEMGLGSDETWLKRILRTNGGDSLQRGLLPDSRSMRLRSRGSWAMVGNSQFNIQAEVRVSEGFYQHG